ncbi:MAG: HNH endonuclease [Myxococcales bacterium]
MTLDASLKNDLESLTSLLSHKIPTGELAEVLREAVHCAIEKHGKRRGAVAPERGRPSRASVPRGAGVVTANDLPASAARSMAEADAQRAVAAPQGATPPPARVVPVGRWSRMIPMAVRREVWNRDGGRCTFESEDGQRCESTWQPELDHVDSAALGGEPTAKNLRMRCRTHNFHHAEEVFGREYMVRFRRGSCDAPLARLPAGEFTIAGASNFARGVNRQMSGRGDPSGSG